MSPGETDQKRGRDSHPVRANKIGGLILNGRGLRYSNFQILTTESSNK